MCKIITFTNSTKLDIKKTANKLGNLLLSIERDGFGYATKGVNGVYGEKCIDDNFKSRLGLKLVNPLTAVKKKYESFGTKSKPVGPMILHGRTSTNDKGLLNCHPMIKDNHYLIHNGVVSDHGPDYMMSTTNDSEHVLHRFLDGIDRVEQYLSGYYAFSCIDDQGRLHIVRDDQATLHMAWSDDIQSYIIATTIDLIDDICDLLSITVNAIDEVQDNIYMIFDGNDLVYQTSILPLGWTKKEAALSSKSLGRELDNDDSELLESYPEDSYVDYWSENAFQNAIQAVDDTCQILTWDDKIISASEFHALPLKHQKDCYIEFSDGTVIEYWIQGA